MRIGFLGALIGVIAVEAPGMAQTGAHPLATATVPWPGYPYPGQPLLVDQDREVPNPTESTDLQPVMPPSRVWIGAEYLLWWVKDGPLPGPVMTTGSRADLVPGALGMPGTRVLVGDSALDYMAHSGARLMLGSWVDHEQAIGVEVVGFVLETHTLHFKQDADRSGFPLVARPFVNALTGGEDAQIITALGLALGGMDIFSDSRLWGAEVNAVGSLFRGQRSRADVLAGFRYLGQKEELRFSLSSTLLARDVGFFQGAPVPPPDILSYRDFVETNDQFYGGQIGIRADYHWGRWRVDAASKIGCGLTSDDVSITGHTLRTDPSGRNSLALGGLLTQRSNLGWDSHDRFSFITEVGLSVGCQITACLNIYLGYDFLLWDGVARPGDQLSRVVDPRQIPSGPLFNPSASPAAPFRSFHEATFWAQGLTCGLTFRF